jgi:hypothetical protein
MNMLYHHNLGGISVPNFAWFGILGLALLYAAGVVMFLAKRKNMIHLRRHHPLLGSAGRYPLLPTLCGSILPILANHVHPWGGWDWWPLLESCSGITRFHGPRRKLIGSGAKSTGRWN